MKSLTTRTHHSPDAIRDALLALGLKEEPQPIDGQTFTFLADLDAAIYVCRHVRGFVPARFSIDRRTFTLSD